MSEEPSVAAVICAAGTSARMGGKKKEYLPLNSSDPSLTVLGAAVSAFAAVSCIKTIVIVIPENDEKGALEALPSEILSGKKPLILFVSGGKNRRASVHRGLSMLINYNPRYVLIHDGARPWVTVSHIEKIIESVKINNAVIPLLPVSETPKEYIGSLWNLEAQKEDRKAEEASPVFIIRHLRRNNTGVAQTPQAFAYPEILHAHEKASEIEYWENTEFTDDAEVWGRFQGPVAVIPGSYENKKITFPSDLS